MSLIQKKYVLLGMWSPRAAPYRAMGDAVNYLVYNGYQNKNHCSYNATLSMKMAWEGGLREVVQLHRLSQMWLMGTKSKNWAVPQHAQLFVDKNNVSRYDPYVV